MSYLINGVINDWSEKHLIETSDDGVNDRFYATTS